MNLGKEIKCILELWDKNHTPVYMPESKKNLCWTNNYQKMKWQTRMKDFTVKCSRAPFGGLIGRQIRMS